MSHAKSTVVIDATPLRTPSGVRGIGRYVYDLLYGLSEIRDEWRDEFDLLALTDLHWTTSPSLTRDLAAAADETIAHRGELQNSAMRQLRRFRTPVALMTTGANLFHESEPLGTPLWGPPRVTTLYDLVRLRYPTQYLNTRLLMPPEWISAQWRYRRSFRVVAISQRSHDDAIELLKLDPKRVDVVQTGIDLRRWFGDPTPADAERLSALQIGQRPYAIYVGYGDYRKNAEGMFAALNHARQKVDVELIWAGKLPDWLQASLVAKARAAGVDAHVRFIGYVDDDTLLSLYRLAAAQLFMSRLEGFGLPVAEGMAAGCPTIVARGSGCDEVVGDSGPVVDPDDSRTAGNWLAKFVGDPAARAEASRKAAAHMSELTRAKMARGYIETYKKALADLQLR